jgi:hypothetical protein
MRAMERPLIGFILFPAGNVPCPGPREKVYPEWCAGFKKIVGWRLTGVIGAGASCVCKSGILFRIDGGIDVGTFGTCCGFGDLLNNM